MVAGVVASLGLMTAPAEAHGPSRLKSEQSVVLNASPEEVWQAIGQFDQMDWLPGAGEIKAEGQEKGALRQRSLEGGVTIEEELLKIQPEKFAISTRLVSDNLDYVSATNYALHLTIKPEGDHAKVEFKGAFYRAFPQNDPPAELNDEASIAAVEALHQTMIDALVAKFGKAE